MDIVQIFILALIQGITEFLPISSSAHLILPKELLGWPDQGLAFDVAVHVGTLMAVLLYFKSDIIGLTAGWCRSVVGKGTNQQGRLAWSIIIATIPVGLAGLLGASFIETHLRSMVVIASTTILFGLLLGFADLRATRIDIANKSKSLAQMGLGLALIIGMFQALALIPGTSRSGITITAALLLGFARQDAARFSFLLSIPVIILSGGHEAVSSLSKLDVDWLSMGLAALISSISAYLCIHYFLSFINTLGMLPFVIYRLLLGSILVGIIAI